MKNERKPQGKKVETGKRGGRRVEIREIDVVPFQSRLESVAFALSRGQGYADDAERDKFRKICERREKCIRDVISMYEHTLKFKGLSFTQSNEIKEKIRVLKGLVEVISTNSFRYSNNTKYVISYDMESTADKSLSKTYYEAEFDSETLPDVFYRYPMDEIFKSSLDTFISKICEAGGNPTKITVYMKYKKFCNGSTSIFKEEWKELLVAEKQAFGWVYELRKVSQD
jgi:hypothetical protein